MVLDFPLLVEQTCSSKTPYNNVEPGWRNWQTLGT